MPDPLPIRVDILAKTDTSPSTLYDVLSSGGVG